MYKVGDEVVILDADKILHAESCGFENDVAYEVFKILEDGSPVLKHDANDRELYFYKRELKYIKKVEKVMYKKGDKLLRTGGSNQFYKKGKEYEVVSCNGERVRFENEIGVGGMGVENVEKFFELVKDDSVPPYETGDKIVFTAIVDIDESDLSVLTVGKVYEVLKYSKGDDRYVEHFVVKGNNGDEFIVRYDEFKYVKKLSELESEMYIRVAPSNDKFNIGEKYEGAECGDYIIFNLNGEGRKLSYTKSNVHHYFEKCSTDTDTREYKHLVKVGDRFLRTGSSGSVFKKGCIYSVHRLDVEGAWLVGDNGQQGFYVFSMLNDPDYFVSVGEAERLREELGIKEKEIENKDKEIAALKATIRILQPLPVTDVNEERKIVIERAKLFVREHFTNKPISKYDYDMIYTESRRMVTVLLKQAGTSKVLLKGQSICARGDVFNLYIGRAIALGRALGIDVSYFENAVQPELAIGQMVKVKEGKWYDRKVVEVIKANTAFTGDQQNTLKYLKKIFNDGKHSNIKIISDTDAQYSIKPL